MWNPDIRPAALLSLTLTERRVVELLAGIAAERGATTAHVALTPLLARRLWIVPIPGTTKLHRLEKNLAATDLGLREAELATIEQAAAEIGVESERYPAHLMAITGLQARRAMRGDTTMLMTVPAGALEVMSMIGACWAP